MSGADLTAPPSPPVESRDDLVHALAKGAKPPAEWRIGTEHEKFSFYLGTNRPVPYEGENGIRALLAGFAARTGASPTVDNGNVIGLKGPDGWNISLEPGGQFELSGAPVASIHDTARETTEHIAIANEVAEPLGIGFLGMGVVPNWALNDIHLMPKSRYAIMRPYMDKVGTLGSSMMMRTCTIQANLDFGSEADMVKKLRLALALQPIATALFANSPFVDARPAGCLSFRSHIWLHTDNARTGMLPFAFEDGFGFERYVDYALDVPMYFVIRDGRYVNVAGESFRAFLGGALPQLPGEKPTVADWENHLSTAFPEVRLKSFLEMRGADMGTAEYIPALAAFWAGLLYDELSLDSAWDLVKHWTAADRATLRNAVPETALHTPIPGSKIRFGTVADLAREIVGISHAGLVRRGLTNEAGEDETVYLEPIEKSLALGANTPADDLLTLYNGAWNFDVNPAFERNRL
jgi:glutamate--cysteine ligase